MTEHDSDKLYEDLRRKLADYGSAPPEAAWEGIRQQLPTSQPRRWKGRAALLLVLCASLLSLTIGTRYWHERSGLARSSAAASAPAEALNHPTGAAAGTRKTEVPASAGARSGAEPTGLEATAGSVSADTRSAASPGSSAAENRSARTMPGGLEKADSRAPRLQPSAGAEAVSASATPRRKRRGALAVLLPTKRAAHATTGLEERYNTPESQEHTAAPEEKRVNRRNSRTGKNSASTSSPAAVAAMSTTADQTAASPRSFSNEPLALLAVRPVLEKTGEPQVQPTTRTPKPHSRFAQLLRGWSVQVAAGPSLTYRTLANDSARQVEQLERPSYGFSGQLTAAYALTEKLTISTGLGYAEYANTLHFQVKKASEETARQVQFRDVYRFVSVPLLAQYSLGGNQRWRFGAVGGANLGLLTGTRTTEGSACNCSQTTAPAEGTYRNTSLVLTAGGFLNYQFAPGKWLTLRPQGQYFLNSLTDPASGRAARHPWAVGVLGGISFDLAPKN